MSLVTVLDEIKKVKPVAEEVIDSGAMETLNARRGRQRRAVERMKELKETYTTDLMNSAVFILVTGSAREEFSKTASEAFGCFSADPEGFYLDLASRVHPTLYEGKQSVSNIFDVLGRHLEDKAGEMNILGYPQLIFKQQYARTIKTKQEFLELVKQAINEQVGGELVGVHVVRSLVDQAINLEHSAKITPIVLGTSDDKLAIQLVGALERLTPKVFLVAAGKSSKQVKTVTDAILVKEVTSDSVQQALAKIRNSIRK